MSKNQRQKRSDANHEQLFQAVVQSLKKFPKNWKRKDNGWANKKADIFVIGDIDERAYVEGIVIQGKQFNLYPKQIEKLAPLFEQLEDDKEEETIMLGVARLQKEGR